MKIYIRGFSDAQKEIERDLTARAEVIVEHLIKLTLLPDNSARNHWQGEIAGQLKTIKRLKNGKKLPTDVQIYKWTYDKYQDLVTDVGWMGVAVKEIEEEYNVKIYKQIYEVCKDVDRVCSEYFSWLSKELSKVGRVASPDIYRKLDELM